MNTRRSGFTLVELLVVTVLGGLLLMSILQTLISNQRTYSAQGAKIQGQQTLRSAADVLFNELREVSAQGGDIVSMTSSQITVRSMRKFGLVCQLSTASPPVLRVTQVGEWMEVGDSAFVFADNNTSLAADDAWISARITAVDTTATCGTLKAQDLSFAGQAARFTADSVRVGGPVRTFVQFGYGLMSYNGATYLGRTDASGTTSPLVGPLDGSAGLRFAYLDSLGSATVVSTDVRQIQLVLKTASPIRNVHGEMVSDSMSALVFTRN
jgi:prepilin-type N-terminal cleavage/methylation domain-containing protein